MNANLPPESPQDEATRRKVMRQRNMVLGLVLGGLAILFFAITIAKVPA